MDPTFNKLNAVNHQSNPAKIYAAGGVRNIEDLQLLESLNIEGALIASALHNGAISNKELQMFQT